MFSLLFMFMLTSAFMFILMNHPLSMGFILLIQTIMTALMTGLMNYNFWFSYILFLIMIGGMLILFIYMTSIASNEKFQFSSKIMFILIMMVMISMLTLFFDQFFSFLISNSNDMINQTNFSNNNLSLNKYFNYPNNITLYLLIIYLLITLIMTVKITNINYGPMRQMF